MLKTFPLNISYIAEKKDLRDCKSSLGDPKNKVVLPHCIEVSVTLCSIMFIATLLRTLPVPFPITLDYLFQLM